MVQTRKQVVIASGVPQPIGAYSNAIQVNASRLLYIAGQVGLDADGNLVGAGDVAAQTKQALANIGAILSSAGASFSDVVEFVTYVVGRDSIQGFIAGRTEVYPQMFPNSEYPTNTLLVIEGLVRPEFLVEIKAIAARP